MSSPITTHVLDTSLGQPARGVPITLEIQDGNDFRPIAQGVTNDDGRIADLLQAGSLQATTYRISFDTKTYFDGQQRKSFYPMVRVVFEIEEPSQHYHVPLLLNPFGYSTYRGS